MAITLDGSVGITTPSLTDTGTLSVTGASTLTGGASLAGVNASPYAMKNRIINGNMAIDQRNAGASVTQSNSVIYGVDRWYSYGTVASKFTVQQNAGSVTPPDGFKNYWGVTSSSSYTVGTSEQFVIVQAIEGYNIADLNFGSSSASSVTLSFWVRSSITGTFAGGIQNGNADRSYSFTYTISSANTWTKISITIPGDTTGTWASTTSTGIFVNFSMGTGSAYQSTVNTWSTGNFKNVAGSVNIVGTNGATFYITGVQLEKGSTATEFEYRPYGMELSLCQRYYQTWGGSVAYDCNFMGQAIASTQVYGGVQYLQQMRAVPTFTSSGSFAVTSSTNVALAATVVGPDQVGIQSMSFGVTVASGLTAGNATRFVTNNNTTARYMLSAEL